MNPADLIALMIVVSLFCLLLAALGYMLEKLTKPKAHSRTNKQRALVDYETRWTP